MCEVMRAPFWPSGSFAIWTRISWPSFSRSVIDGVGGGRAVLPGDAPREVRRAARDETLNGTPNGTRSGAGAKLVVRLPVRVLARGGAFSANPDVDTAIPAHARSRSLGASDVAAVPVPRHRLPRGPK